MINLLKKENGITAITLIIVIILALVLIFIYAKTNANFVKTTATITNSRYDSSSETSMYYYEYTVDGKDYSGSFSDGLFYKYKINDEITIKYEEDNPNISKRADIKPFIITFFIMLAIGLVVKYFSDRMSLF